MLEAPASFILKVIDAQESLSDESLMYNCVKFNRLRFKMHDKQDGGHKQDLALSKQAFSSSLSSLLLQEKGTAKLTSAY